MARLRAIRVKPSTCHSGQTIAWVRAKFSCTSGRTNLCCCWPSWICWTGGRIAKNEIRLDRDLVETFRRYFDVVRQRDDKPTIENPYYFLSGDGFWNLEGAGGRRLYEVGNATSPPSMKILRASPGRFDPQLWDLMQKPGARYRLREALIGRYFPEQRRKLEAMLGTPVPAQGLQLNEEFEEARSCAFRQTVLEIYDYMCAACGLRAPRECIMQSA